MMAWCLLWLLMLCEAAHWNHLTYFDKSAINERHTIVTPTCQHEQFEHRGYCNRSLTTKERAVALVAEMNLDQKVSQLGTAAPAIPELGVIAYEYWSEALHGVAHSPGVKFTGPIGSATSFPQVIGLGASFDMELVRKIAVATSLEARTMHTTARQTDLIFFSPNINVFRDPRWGRGQETPGEDPLVCSRYAKEFVLGIEGGPQFKHEGNSIISSAACCKHFFGYDLEDWQNGNRFDFDAKIGPRDAVETFLPPFESCVNEANVSCIMCSYNLVNGVPSCANHWSQQQYLRNELQFDGFVVSDCGAIFHIHETVRSTQSAEEAVAMSLKAGCDLNCGVYYQAFAAGAVQQGLMEEHDIEVALHRIFNIRFKLGEFDFLWPDDRHVDFEDNDHENLALIAAKQSIVLLKNKEGILPLSKGSKLSVIGPHAMASVAMLGNYYGNPSYLISPAQAIAEFNDGGEVVVGNGCGVNEPCLDSELTEVDEMMAVARITIAVIGIDQSIEREAQDRNTLQLPENQIDLLERMIKNKNANDGRLIVVVMSGGSFTFGEKQQQIQEQIDALLWAGYPGQMGGQAIAEILFGNYCPSARLPFTMYFDDYVAQVAVEDMNLRPHEHSPGQTYRFYTGTPWYPFGSGLSYVDFEYLWDNNEVIQFATNSSPISIPFTVENKGNMDSDHVVLAFISHINVAGAPIKQLIDFKKVFISASSRIDTFITLDQKSLSLVDEDGSVWVRPGRAIVTIDNLKKRIQITGEENQLKKPLKMSEE